MGSEYITSKEILRPPGISSSVTTSSTQSGVFSEEDDDESLTHKVFEQDEEIKELKSEVRKLRQCVKGVHVIGRELQKSKEDYRRLKRTVSGGSNKQGNDEWINDETDKDAIVVKPGVKVAEDDNSASSSSEESSDEDESSSTDASSSHSGSGDELDGLDEDADYDKDEQVKPPVASVKRKRKTRIKAKPPQDLQQLSAENSQLREEIEELKAAKEAETFHYVTSTEANELQKTAPNVSDGEKASVGLDTGDLGWEKRFKELEIENTDLKATVKEIKNVNHKWDQFWKDKKADYETKMKGKDDEICRLQEDIVYKDEEIEVLRDRHDKESMEHDASINKMERVLAVEANEKECVLKEKEELLLLAKERIDKSEAKIEELGREMCKEQQKCDRAQKLARNLLKQKKELEEEIKRLNGTLTEKCEEHSLLKSMDPQVSGTAEIHLSAADEGHHRPSSPLSPSHMCTEQEFTGGVRERKAYDRRQRIAAPSVMGHQELLTEEERSMTKDELKEKVELFREQTEAYESDFRRERRDRETVVGELDSVKKELREAKAILHNGPKSPMFTHRQKDRPVYKDPLRHELPEYRRQTTAQKYYYPNKRDNLRAHGHGTSSKPKERSQPKPHREHHYQHRYFNEYREYERDTFDDEEERYHVCRCPKHDCYVPVAGQPKNNLSKMNGAC